MNDVHLAGRSLSKDKAFSLLAVLVLALGIGGVVTQFSLLNGLMLRLPAFAQAEQLMTVGLVDSARGQPAGGVGTADYLDWVAAQRSFQDLALFAARPSINVTDRGVIRRAGAARCSAGCSPGSPASRPRRNSRRRPGRRPSRPR
jgi:hypothetical protein